MSTPKAFISYSHDSLKHKKWVLELATRLRNNGIDAALDQWDMQPGDDVPHFMEKNVASCDYAIMVCTEEYVRKANNGTGGVGYEKMILTADLMSRLDGSKVIPIIRQNGSTDVPTFLRTKLYIDFSHFKEFEFAYDQLVRKIHQAPLFRKPAIGNNPFEKVDTENQDRSNDGVYDIIACVVKAFESGENGLNYYELAQHIDTSRIMLDLNLKKAIEKGLIERFEDYVFLTDSGKFYAVEKDLVDR